MLKQRIITATVLLALLLPALFYPSAVAFSAFALVLITAAAWEWARLNGLGNFAAIGLAAACFTTCCVAWAAGLVARPLPVLWAVAGCVWVLGGAYLLRSGVSGWSRIPKAARLLGGLLALWLAWLAIAQARFLGIEFLLSILLLVWVADVFAYFAGRTLGGRFSKNKLAPSISPGKSWEGVWGGMAGVVVLAASWALLAPGNSIFNLLMQRYGLLVCLLATAFLALMSVVGDLVESLIKRSAGVKDSSRLLPGHGGVLDRIDALLPTLPLAMMLVSFTAFQV